MANFYPHLPISRITLFAIGSQWQLPQTISSDGQGSNTILLSQICFQAFKNCQCVCLLVGRLFCLSLFSKRAEGYTSMLLSEHFFVTTKDEHWWLNGLKNTKSVFLIKYMCIAPSVLQARRGCWTTAAQVCGLALQLVLQASGDQVMCLLRARKRFFFSFKAEACTGFQYMGFLASCAPRAYGERKFKLGFV